MYDERKANDERNRRAEAQRTQGCGFHTRDYEDAITIIQVDNTSHVQSVDLELDPKCRGDKSKNVNLFK